MILNQFHPPAIPSTCFTKIHLNVTSPSSRHPSNRFPGGFTTKIRYAPKTVPHHSEINSKDLMPQEFGVPL